MDDLERLEELRQQTLYKLSDLFKKKYVLFTNRCNVSIKLALSLADKLKRKNVIIQDEGGWLTYKEDPHIFGMHITELKTDYGLINPDDLSNHKGAVLLINSMPGYVVLQNMEELEEACEKNDIFLINDVCGSVGTPECVFGEIIVCSFGRWKPLNAGFGGCIATDDEAHYKFFLQQNSFSCEDEEGFLNILNEKLDALPDRLTFFEIKKQQILDDLSEMDIIHPNGAGLNAIIKYSTPDEKKIITEYCKDNGYEYIECPRYIRTNSKAISVEVKRLEAISEEEYDDSTFVEPDDDE